MNPHKLRQVLETFYARYALDNGDNLTVPQLALLANMGEAAVRTSISAEGIKTVASHEKGEKNQVPHADALIWLAGRRGFVPTKSSPGSDINQTELMFSLFTAESLSFESALQKAIAAAEGGETGLSERAGVEKSWLEKLTAVDASPDINLTALESLSGALGAPMPIFVGKAVTALLSRRERVTLDS
jgi:hypothetical protein